MPAASLRSLYLHAVTQQPKPGLAEHDKLDRLRELRAAISALREGSSPTDPLVAWAMATARAQAPRDLSHND
jgi:hypothetical protein